MSGSPIPEQLQALVRDPRYRQGGADGDAYRSAVTSAFRAQYGDAASQGGFVHVNQYRRRGPDGAVQTVQARVRGAPQRAWEGQPNEAWRQQIAREESNREGGDFGYGVVNADGTAFGRYQIRRAALADAGWLATRAGGWTAYAAEQGVRSDSDFLASPAAQEAALNDVMRRNQDQLRANGAYRRIGQQVTSLDGTPLRVTESGLAAAAHREGAGRTREYLAHREAGLPRPQSLRGQRGLLSSFNEIERRLRAFADTPYQAPR